MHQLTEKNIGIKILSKSINAWWILNSTADTCWDHMYRMETIRLRHRQNISIFLHRVLIEPWHEDKIQ